jgi:hypothetical protein
MLVVSCAIGFFEAFAQIGPGPRSLSSAQRISSSTESALVSYRCPDPPACLAAVNDPIEPGSVVVSRVSLAAPQRPG